jgi:acid phosphatase (class A)
MRLAPALLAAAALAWGACASGALAQKTPTAGYLAAQAQPDTIRILPPAPVAGSARDKADRSLFLATRRFKDTPRWALARSDSDEKAILKDFRCAVGADLTAQSAPQLASLLLKVRPDVRRAVDAPKNLYQRKRPYLVDQGPICVDKAPDLAVSPDYPSGHSTWGWTVGLILAELAPDRATDILVRARAFGESRLVCGVHNLSAVEAGRTNASAVVAALHGSADFRGDLDAARKEVAAARASGPAPDPTACAAEAALTAKSPY